MDINNLAWRCQCIFGSLCKWSFYVCNKPKTTRFKI